MSYQIPRLVQRHARVLIATVAAVSIAAATMFAQFGAFDPQHQGQLWGVRQELPSAGGYPAGTVFVGGTLFVADQGNQQVVAYNTSTWAAVDVSGGDWNDITTVGAPAYGLVVNEMAKATVNGADAILISDLSQPRVLAFDTTGAHLFTLRLDNPNRACPSRMRARPLLMEARIAGSGVMEGRAVLHRYHTQCVVPASTPCRRRPKGAPAGRGRRHRHRCPR